MGSSSVAVTQTSDFTPVQSKEFLAIQATRECGFTLKRVRDMIRTYSYNISSSFCHEIANSLFAKKITEVILKIYFNQYCGPELTYDFFFSLNFLFIYFIISSLFQFVHFLFVFNLFSFCFYLIRFHLFISSFFLQLFFIFSFRFLK